MATFCLTKQQKEKFKDALRKGEVNLDKLSDFASSEERRKYLAQFVGEENAKQVNALVESKINLPNQKAALYRFAEKTLGLEKKANMDIFSKIERIDTLLNPKDLKSFYSDLVDRKLGFEPTIEEARIMSDLSRKVTDLGEKANIEAIKKLSPKEGIEYIRNKENNIKRMEYGRAVIALDNYVTELKQNARKTSLSEKIKSPIQTSKNIIGATLDLSKAQKASLDDSALLNQGFPILANILTSKIWAKNALKSFSDIVKTVGGKEVWDELRADVVSRPNYLNGMYKKSNLAVMVTEEDFPTNLSEKILNIPQAAASKITGRNLGFLKAGNLYKGTEVAFSGFQLRNRVDVFDLFLAISDKFNQGITIANVEETGLGKLVNSLTSRGSLGKFEPVANLVNAPFFSLRKQVSTIESLLFYQTGKKSTYTRVVAASATLQQIILIATILSIAKMLKDDSVEEDSTSSDYGKIKIGDTRFDVTQGRGSYLTLAMRLATGKVKGTTTGDISELNGSEYNARLKTDVLGDFVQNKLSPFLGQLIAVLNEKDRQGNKPTVKSVLTGLYLPLGIENMSETINNPKSANLIAIALADTFGIPTNTYSVSNLQGQYIPEGAIITTESFLKSIDTYAKANNINSEQAYKKMFAGQMVVGVGKDHITIIKEGEKVSKVSGGRVIAERMSVTASQAEKKAASKNYKKMILDHTIPLEFGIQYGGTNKDENTTMRTESDAKGWIKVENTLGKAIKNKKIDGYEAAKLITKMKAIEDKKKRDAFGKELIEKYK